MNVWCASRIFIKNKHMVTGLFSTGSERDQSFQRKNILSNSLKAPTLVTDLILKDCGCDY